MLVKSFTEALAQAGMTLGPAKCRTLSIVINGKTKAWFCSPDSYLKIDGVPVKAMTVSETYRYLGLHIGADRIQGADLKEIIVAKLGKLQKAALNPQQKLHGLRTVVVPRVFHWRDGFLRSLDRLVRAFVRQAVHLPKDTPTAYFHAATSLGGLGIPCIRTQTIWLRAQRLDALVDSQDKAVLYLLNQPFIQWGCCSHMGGVGRYGLGYRGLTTHGTRNLCSGA